MDIISIIKKYKTGIKYSIFILIFILFICTITITFLEINLRQQGRSIIVNNYYDIIMTNATIDFETTSKIKLDNDNKVINVKIDDLSKYINGNSFNLELNNIGNIDAQINDIKIVDIDSNVDSDLVEITLSLNEDTVIYASEKKILNILIKYNEKKPRVEDYINFNIKISYKEVVK